MFSVVIPAHNEERTLARCLDALLRDTAPETLRTMQIVVVCNGCSDRTAEVAASYGDDVEVVDTPVASKPHALNLGDAHATAFPRFYLDADIEVPSTALARCAKLLEGGPCLAAAPRLEVDLEGCPWSVRAYYRIWLALPYVREGLIGSGLYGLSEAGRARFGAFPDIIADDLFVRNLFAPAERCSVGSVAFRMRAARTLRDLVTRKTRVFAGNLQLARSSLPRSAAAEAERPALLRVVLRHPGLLRDLPVYLAVSVLGRLKARRRALRGDFVTWDRDESTR